MTAEPASPFDPPAGFRPIIQYPDLPTGCETTSLTMVLNYLGYPVDKLDLADHYLDKNRSARRISTNILSVIPGMSHPSAATHP